MKKSIVLLLIVCLFIITGCNSKDNYMEIAYKDDHIHEPSTNYTYRFVGQSDHFYFQTGKVYYEDNYRSLIISNFNVKENMDKNTTYTVNVYFSGKLFYGNSYEKDNKGDFSLKEYKDLVISESGFLGEKDENGDVIGESDSFLETTKETFKNRILVEVKYCTDNECKTEKLKLEYV